MEQQALELRSRQATVTAFGDLVDAMRAVAASRAQRARQMIAGVQAYGDTIAAAIASARALAPQESAPGPANGGRSLRILFCPEQGFTGGLTDRVLDALPRQDGGQVLLVGSQGRRACEARGIAVQWVGPALAHADAAVSSAEHLHAVLARAMALGQAASLELVHARLESGQQVAACRRIVLPLARAADTGTREPPPLTQLPAASLMDELVFEHVAAQLLQALLHAHAAENVARLQAMASAHENVVRMVDALDADMRRLRQEAITAEIIELAAGMRSLRREDADPAPPSPRQPGV